MMPNDLTLIQKLIAVELGCEWEAKSINSIDPYFFISEKQSLEMAIKIQRRGQEIRLTSREWDWPICERDGVICWHRYRVGTLTGKQPNPPKYFAWTKTIARLESAFSDEQYVLPDPRAPDQEPPGDWSPEGRRVIS
jgi:hypothetical protein